MWSEHEDEESADAELARLREVLHARADPELTPPVATDAIDIIGDQRGVMWGAPPWVPLSIVARVILLLAFPLAGAVALLRRRGGLMAYGATAQFGELRAWERSGVSQIVPIRHVRHVGFGNLVLSGAPIAMRLVAHTEQDTAVEALVPRSAFANLAEQACRLLAEMHEIGGNRPEWSVRLPGGIAEAIEAVSWVQRLVAEARQERAEVMD